MDSLNKEFDTYNYKLDKLFNTVLKKFMSQLIKQNNSKRKVQNLVMETTNVKLLLIILWKIYLRKKA